VWGEGSHNGVYKGKLWIFFARNIFFSILKKKKIKKIIFFFKIFSENFFWTPVLQAWYSQIWPNLGQIWVNFGQKGPFLKFLKRSENVIFFYSRDYASSKKLGKSDARFLKKILGKKGKFWTVFGQNGQNGENYQKSAWNIFPNFLNPNFI